MGYWQYGKTSLVVQWIRIHLPMQWTQIWTLVPEDSTPHGATKSVSHNYWAHMPRACALKQDRLPQWEARALKWSPKRFRGDFRRFRCTFPCFPNFQWISFIIWAFFFLNIMALEKLSCSLEIKEERHVCGTTFLNQSICQNYLKCFFHNPYLTLTHHYCRDSDLVCPKKKKILRIIWAPLLKDHQFQTCMYFPYEKAKFQTSPDSNAFSLFISS